MLSPTFVRFATYYITAVIGYLIYIAKRLVNISVYRQRNGDRAVFIIRFI